MHVGTSACGRLAAFRLDRSDFDSPHFLSPRRPALTSWHLPAPIPMPPPGPGSPGRLTWRWRAALLLRLCRLPLRRWIRPCWRWGERRGAIRGDRHQPAQRWAMPGCMTRVRLLGGPVAVGHMVSVVGGHKFSAPPSPVGPGSVAPGAYSLPLPPEVCRYNDGFWRVLVVRTSSSESPGRWGGRRPPRRWRWKCASAALPGAPAHIANLAAFFEAMAAPPSRPDPKARSKALPTGREPVPEKGRRARKGVGAADILLCQLHRHRAFGRCARPGAVCDTTKKHPLHLQ